LNGWMGEILRVNLTTGDVTAEALHPDIAARYLGGRGLGARILYDEVKPGADPLGPENRLVFAVGPLTGTNAPTSGRFSLSTKSPLTGTVHDSNAGGVWGVVFKRCGFDALVVEGRAPEPCYLFVSDEGAEIRDARRFWGGTTSSTILEVKKEVPKGAAVLAIGPAGENLVRIASICVEGRRALARGGVGAVMGSKNLKAVAVRGSRPVRVADRERLDFVAYEADKLIKANPVTAKALPEFGTAVLVNLMNEHGILPTRNFQQGQFEHAGSISGEAVTGSILARRRACYRCPIACGREVRLGRSTLKGPEYESLWALGADCGIGDLEALVRANALCDDLGLDTISTGGVVACAMELAERGAIDDGPRFGDAALQLDLIGKIARREGLGDEMAEGSARFARGRGAVEFAMQVKGLELPAYEPRGMHGQGLAFATSNRGGCHLRANMLGVEVLGIPKMLDRFAGAGKAGFLIVLQNSHAAQDSLVLCKFAGYAVTDEFYARLLSAATGEVFSAQDVQEIGERIWTLERLFNSREGFARKDDSLPTRITSEPLEEGPARGGIVDLEPMLNEYYRFRGWSAEGIPTAHKLERLGLGGDATCTRSSPR